MLRVSYVPEYLRMCTNECPLAIIPQNVQYIYSRDFRIKIRFIYPHMDLCVLSAPFPPGGQLMEYGRLYANLTTRNFGGLLFDVGA